MSTRQTEFNAGRDPKGPADAAIRQLSASQSAILDWIAEGKSNLDIGAIMGMTERTVRYHVSEILRKLDVASRTQAARVRHSASFDQRHPGS